LLLIESVQYAIIATKMPFLVLLPGFQKGRDIKASLGKGQGAVFGK
jgi:hypothetical protein